MTDDSRLEMRITGRVQGVWFRDSTQREAARIGGLTGFVRNVPDGTVEVVAEGPREACESLLEWCGRGPRMARVDGVVRAWSRPSGEFETFRVVYGA